MLPQQCALLLAITAAIAWLGIDPGSAVRHVYLAPALWAAWTSGARGGAVIGLVSGLLQAPMVLPAIERVGLTSGIVDALLSLVFPLALGWAVGRLVDQARERAWRLQGVLALQQALNSEASMEARLRHAAERIRHSLGAERVGLVVGAGADDRVVASVPDGAVFEPASAAGRTLVTGEPITVADLPSDPRVGSGPVEPTPTRGLVLPLDAGAGVLGVLALQWRGDWPPAARAAAEEAAMHLALGIENVRLTLRQRRFAAELEAKVAAATERLRDLDRAKTEFISVVAHELRTPLTALQGFSELLLERSLPAERTTRFLRHIHGEAERLGRIVAELLDVSRIEAGRGPLLNPEPVEIGPLIERNVELFAAEHRGHRFEWRVVPEAGTLLADRDAVDRMLKNLLSNAIKYSPHGGRILIGVRPALDGPGLIELSVEDDGVGIPAEHLSRIWDRYVRVPNPETVSARGLGLGLCLVRALAEAHGGGVDVESLPGKGSRFRLLLPAPVPQFLANFPDSSR